MGELVRAERAVNQMPAGDEATAGQDGLHQPTKFWPCPENETGNQVEAKTNSTAPCEEGAEFYIRAHWMTALGVGLLASRLCRRSFACDATCRNHQAHDSADAGADHASHWATDGITDGAADDDPTDGAPTDAVNLGFRRSVGCRFRLRRRRRCRLCTLLRRFFWLYFRVHGHRCFPCRGSPVVLPQKKAVTSPGYTAGRSVLFGGRTARTLC